VPGGDEHAFKFENTVSVVALAHVFGGGVVQHRLFKH
jgi:hypothetical protein